jgi:Family of unknown function (DUF6433)
MQKYLPEELTEINANPSMLEQMRGNAALTTLFKHAFDPQFKFLLPEGEPPFKKDPAPMGMSYAILRQELRTFYVFCRADLPAIKREDKFIQLLENVHPSEAELLISIKDQTLTAQYPNITHQLVYDLGFVNNAPPEKPKKVVKSKKATGAAE